MGLNFFSLQGQVKKNVIYNKFVFSKVCGLNSIYTKQLNIRLDDLGDSAFYSLKHCNLLRTQIAILFKYLIPKISRTFYYRYLHFNCL